MSHELSALGLVLGELTRSRGAAENCPVLGKEQPQITRSTQI